MNAFKYLYLLIRFVLGAVFIYTGIIHMMEPAAFSEAVSAYRILPSEVINIIAIILPFIELLAGLSLVTGLWALGGSTVITGMLLVFFVALTASLIRGLDISCGCFTTSRDAEKITWIYLLRDTVFILVSGFVMYKEYRKHVDLNIKLTGKGK